MKTRGLQDTSLVGVHAEHQRRSHPSFGRCLGLCPCRFCPPPDDKPVVLGVACLLEPQPCGVGEGGGQEGGRRWGWGREIGGGVKIRVYINIFKAA